MRPILRRTRETLRHERATVLQQKGADQVDALALTPAQIRRNKATAAQLRHKVQQQMRGGDPDAARMGLVTDKTLAGGKGTMQDGQAGSPACTYCNDQAGGCWFCGRG